VSGVAGRFVSLSRERCASQHGHARKFDRFARSVSHLLRALETFNSLGTHDEKSYWPPTLNRWFEENGFSVVRQIYFGVVPYFCPMPIARTLKSVEPLFEALPLIREITCGTNLVLYSKR
jgi:hypothetical protein